MTTTITQRSALMVVFIVSLLTIIGAFLFQWAGYAPCPLCLQQRWAYYAVIPLSLIFAGIDRSNAGIARWGLLLIALILIANSIFGIYHAGAEWKFWPGPQSCSGVGKVTAADLNAFLEGAKVRGPSCEDAAWRFAGLSMAGWNALVSLGLAAMSVLSAIRERAKI